MKSRTSWDKLVKDCFESAYKKVSEDSNEQPMKSVIALRKDNEWNLSSELKKMAAWTNEKRLSILADLIVMEEADWKMKKYDENNGEFDMWHEVKTSRPHIEKAIIDGFIKSRIEQSGDPTCYSKSMTKKQSLNDLKTEIKTLRKLKDTVLIEMMKDIIVNGTMTMLIHGERFKA